MSDTVQTETAPTGRASVEIFRPLRLRKVVDEVVTAVIDAIHGGAINPGDRLPREVDLAARLEVSRNTVGEALARLERAGVVTVRRGSRGGAVVETRSIPADLLVPLEGETPAELREILEARRPLETQASLLAARRASKEDLDHLGTLVRLLDDHLADPSEFLALDSQFHAEIGRLSHNALIASYLGDLIRRLFAMRDYYPVGHVPLEVGRANQQASLDALRTRDEAAILASVDAHLGSVEEHFLGSKLDAWQPTARDL